jgi:DNA invertase Pin-like site-specific DNA recombinase
LESLLLRVVGAGTVVLAAGGPERPGGNEDVDLRLHLLGGRDPQDLLVVGISLEAIRRAAEYHGWELRETYSEVASGKSTNGRPGLEEALRCVESPDCAEILVVARLDRLSRSVSDFARLMERARRKGWAIVALDLNIDTTTATGEMMANLLAVLAQWERRLIGERTSETLQALKAKGVRLGRPRTLDQAVRRRIHRMRARGMTLSGIASKLTEEGVPTAHGGQRWYASTVAKVLQA